MARFAPRKVPKAVGNNPIAQAVARKQVHDSIVSTRINLHMLEEGEDCGSLLNDMAFLLLVMSKAVWWHNFAAMVQAPTADEVAVVDGIAALEKTSGLWDKSHLAVLDASLAAADRLYRTLPGSAINTVLQNISKGS